MRWPAIQLRTETRLEVNIHFQPDLEVIVVVAMTSAAGPVARWMRWPVTAGVTRRNLYTDKKAV